MKQIKPERISKRESATAGQSARLCLLYKENLEFTIHSHFMNILMIEPSGSGGLDHYTYNLSNALVSLNNRILHLTGKNNDTYDLPREYESIRVFQKYKTNPLSLFRLNKRIKAFGPHIVHFQCSVHPEMYLLLYKYLKFFLDSKFILTIHEITPQKYKRFHSWFYQLLYKQLEVYKILLKKASRIIVHSELNKQELIDIYGIDESKVNVVHHGSYIFLKQLQDSSSSKDPVSEISGDKKIVLFFGIIVPDKGLIHLIRAFKKVIDQEPRAHLLIAGKPIEDVEPYYHEIERLNLEESVTFHARYIPLDEVHLYFSKSDIVALPYVNTTTSGILFASYAFGKPVVATRCGSHPEYVSHGESGLLVTVKDEEDLSQAILSLLHNDEKRLKMGRFAEKLARENYSWENAAVITSDIYKEVISRMPR